MPMSLNNFRDANIIMNLNRYAIYTLQHAIHLAMQIESQIESQRQRNFNGVIKRLDKV